MRGIGVKRLALAAGVVGVVAAIATVSASGGSRAGATSSATLTVGGSGAVSYTPDTATLTFGASSQRKTAVAAAAANAIVMNGVLAALQRAGATNVSTNELSVGPAYAQGTSGIVGFSAGNSVQGTTTVDRIGALMDTAVAAGATTIQGPSFSTTKDQSVLYKTALRAAVAQAKAQAQVLADDAGVTLGPLVSITPNSYSPVATAQPASAPAPTSTPVIPPTQSVSANVTLVFSVS